MPTPSALPDQWRAQATDYLRISKSYTCAANRSVREGYVKAAAVYLDVARQLDQALALGSTNANSPSTTQARGIQAERAVGEADREALDGQALAQEEGVDPEAGSIPVPTVHTSWQD